MQHLFKLLMGTPQTHHYSYGCSVVDHVYGRVEWGENDPTSVDTINGDLVRRLRVLPVWSGMPIAIKVDTAAVDSWTRDHESWGGGQYYKDGIATYCLS